METQSAKPESNTNGARQSRGNAEGSGLSIPDILFLLASRKKLILSVTLLVTAAAAAGTFFMRNTFKGEAVILPPQQQQSSLAALASGALGNLGTAVRTPSDLYVGMLRSRSICDGIVAHFHLQEIYKKKFASDARRALIQHTSFATGKDSLIVISVEDYDPHRAAAIANAFVDGLYQLTSRLALTEASQKRLFFEQELRKEKDTLNDAEVALTNVQRATGLLIPAGQEGVLIQSTARLRAEILSHEVELRAMQTYATDDNPQVQILLREIATMRGQLNDLETKGASESKFEISAGKLPDGSLAYVRKVRDVKYHETLYELLAKQYEAARLDEAKQAPLIQVIDRAVVPDKKSGPARTRLVLSAALLGFVLSSLYVLILFLMKSNPQRVGAIAT
jgi:uncharacterized protein involved in exopolysaccharide biosynthesis